MYAMNVDGDGLCSLIGGSVTALSRSEQWEEEGRRIIRPMFQ
jgi:hypothetical protein